MKDPDHKTIDIFRRGISREGMLLAWSGLWLVKTMGEHKLLAIPRLRLSQQATFELTSRMSYAEVFVDSVVAVSDDPPRKFYVVHATFDLYRTGEPDILGFAAIVVHPDHEKPETSVVISQTAKMLRGEI